MLLWLAAAFAHQRPLKKPLNAAGLAVQGCQARISSSGGCQVNVARTLDTYPQRLGGSKRPPADYQLH